LVQKILSEAKNLILIRIRKDASLRSAFMLIFSAKSRTVWQELSMNTPQPNEVTSLLLQLRRGEPSAVNALFPLVYSELRRIASAFLQDENRNHTLQTTDLVHEAFLKMVGTDQQTYENRAHFFSIAANSMRQILIDEARKRKAAKRGGGITKVSLDEGAILTDDTADQLVTLDDAMKELATFDEQLSRIVELRFFAGLTIEETADVLSVSSSTVKREWNTAKAWLYREMSTF
jgi:RNA polymerase sigma factor (TIGR02999 family)